MKAKQKRDIAILCAKKDAKEVRLQAIGNLLHCTMWAFQKGRMTAEDIAKTLVSIEQLRVLEKIDEEEIETETNYQIDADLFQFKEKK